VYLSPLLFLSILTLVLCACAEHLFLSVWLQIEAQPPFLLRDKRVFKGRDQWKSRIHTLGITKNIKWSRKFIQKNWQNIFNSANTALEETYHISDMKKVQVQVSFQNVTKSMDLVTFWKKSKEINLLHRNYFKICKIIVWNSKFTLYTLDYKHFPTFKWWLSKNRFPEKTLLWLGPIWNRALQLFVSINCARFYSE